MKLRLTIVAEYELDKDAFDNPDSISDADILRMEQEQLHNEGEVNYLGILPESAMIKTTLEEVK